MRRLLNFRGLTYTLDEVTIDLMPIVTTIAAYMWFGWHGVLLVVLLKSSLTYTKRF